MFLSSIRCLKNILLYCCCRHIAGMLIREIVLAAAVGAYIFKFCHFYVRIFVRNNILFNFFNTINDSAMVFSPENLSENRIGGAENFPAKVHGCLAGKGQSGFSLFASERFRGQGKVFRNLADYILGGKRTTRT